MFAIFRHRFAAAAASAVQKRTFLVVSRGNNGYTDGNPSSVDSFRRIRPSSSSIVVSQPTVRITRADQIKADAIATSASSLESARRIPADSSTKQPIVRPPDFAVTVLPSANITFRSARCVLPLLGFSCAYARDLMLGSIF
jgi:hypothetical protein